MHDIRQIRENPAAFDAALSRRGLAPLSDELLALDAHRRANILAAETAQAEQNRASKEVGAAKARGDDAEFERLRALQRVNPGVRESEVEALAWQLEALRAALPQARVRLDAIRLAVSPDFLRLVPGGAG